MALELGSVDQAGEAPQYEQYVVASRLNVPVPFEDMTAAMMEVRARELARDDGMLVMGYSGDAAGERLYRQRDGFTAIGAQIANSEIREQSQNRDTSASEKSVQIDQEWFERHSFHIREANTVAAYPAEQMAVPQAYWSGQRDLYNSIREDAITLNPNREKDLPAAIEFDEIRVRQRIQEPDQSLGLAL
jgi:hypothetical protein